MRTIARIARQSLWKHFGEKIWLRIVVLRSFDVVLAQECRAMLPV
jgi:hypothetical protein